MSSMRKIIRHAKPGLPSWVLEAANLVKKRCKSGARCGSFNTHLIKISKRVLHPFSPRWLSSPSTVGKVLADGRTPNKPPTCILGILFDKLPYGRHFVPIKSKL
jgi:hypothetical protein